MATSFSTQVKIGFLILFISVPCASKSNGDNPGIPGEDAVQAISKLDLYPGLEATLFASEPEILSPTNIDIDHRGRVWLCEVVNYRAHGRSNRRPEGDRILILEDGDGDGVADTKKVYYQGRDVDAALGIAVLGNKVIITCAPNVIIFTDEDGDDQPDRKEMLFTRSGLPQNDHSTHSFVFGPDGKYYWNMGNGGRYVHDADGRLVMDQSGNPVLDRRAIRRSNEFAGMKSPYWGGMVFRCNPDGSGFEVLAHNFRNNYEVAVDSFGNIWQSDNDDDGNYGVRLNFIMEHGNYGYLDEFTGAGWRKERVGQHKDTSLRHWHQNDPGVVPNFVQTGAGSPTGITVYEGDLLPERFHGKVIHCDAGPGVVWAAMDRIQGAGFTGSMIHIVKGERDKWFRPVDVAVSPDGCLFISDWHDPVVGWNRQADTHRGRIFRIAPKGHVCSIQKADTSRVDEAIMALKSPNLSQRHLGWKALSYPSGSSLKALESVFKSDTPHFRARALWLLSQSEDSGEFWIRKALEDRDEWIRVVALKAAQRQEMDLLPLIRISVKDPSVHVRRECALQLRSYNSPEAVKLWTELALHHREGDRWYLEALGIGAEYKWDACMTSWTAKQDKSPKSASGRDVIWRSRAEITPALLSSIIAEPEVNFETAGRYIRAFDFQQASPEKDRILKFLLGAIAEKPADNRLAISIEILKRLEPTLVFSEIKNDQTINSLVKLAEGTPFYLELIDLLKLQEKEQFLLAHALKDIDEKESVRALNILIDTGNADYITEFLRTERKDGIGKLTRLLAGTGRSEAVAILSEILLNESHEFTIRENAVRGLARMNGGADVLIALARDNLFPEEFKETAGAGLTGLMHVTNREEVEKYFPLPPLKNNKPIPQMTELLVYRGNPERGEIVFLNTSCVDCHRVNGQGISFGPDLSKIGSKMSKQGIYESILDPSASVSPSYQGILVRMKNGEDLTGYITSETEKSISLRVAGGETRIFDSDSVQSRTQQDLSLMPDGLQQLMTFDELVDLVQYLAELK